MYQDITHHTSRKIHIHIENASKHMQERDMKIYKEVKFLSLLHAFSTEMIPLKGQKVVPEGQKKF